MDKTAVITQAYKDALRLADHIDPFKGHDELFAPNSPDDTVSTQQGPDALAERLFEKQSSRGSEQANHVQCEFLYLYESDFLLCGWGDEGCGGGGRGFMWADLSLSGLS